MAKAQFKKLITLAAIIIIAAAVLLSLMPGGGAVFASAASAYSSPLEDLQKDENFNAADYPERADDYKLEVIQIAETTSGGLYVYVYQPSGQKAGLRASSIRFARTKGGDPRDYELTYINSTGTIFNYQVKNFNVTTSETERYYDITAIFRPFNKDYDTEPDNGDTTSEKSFEDAQVWKATTTAGGVTYEMEQTDVAVIKSGDMNIGYRRISNGGVNWAKYEKCDAHFVAFRCDKKIDELFEADITFNTQDYRNTVSGTTKYDPVPHTDTVKGTQTAQNKPYGAFGQKYKWDRIQTVEDFLKDKISSFTEEEKNELKKYTWVLNFYETEYEGFNGVYAAGVALTSPGLWWASIPLLLGSNSEGTFVSDVSVLRLNFQTGGKTYNLGVVSDKQTGTQTPIGSEPAFDFWKWLANLLGVPEWAAKLIFAAVVIVIAVIILGVLCAIFPPFKKVLYVLLKIVFFPFTLIYYLIKSCEGHRNTKRERKPAKPKKIKKRR